jgi:salicylate 5-hydroxylase small subunit
VAEAQPAQTLSFETWMALQQLQADYAAALDSGDWDRWPQFFTEQCVYRIQPRENH